MALMALQITAYAAKPTCDDCAPTSCAKKDGPYKFCKEHCKGEESWDECSSAHKKAKAAAAKKKKVDGEIDAAAADANAAIDADDEATE